MEFWLAFVSLWFIGMATGSLIAFLLVEWRVKRLLNTWDAREQGQRVADEIVPSWATAARELRTAIGKE